MNDQQLLAPVHAAAGLRVCSVAFALLFGPGLLAAGEPDRPATLDPLSQHPVVVRTNKEGYNTLAELQSALDAKSYQDACRIIVDSQASDSLGLFPDRNDPGRWLCLSATIAEAMNSHPQLVVTMQQQFGPLGSLRVTQAIAEGNAAAVAELCLRFPRTEAARQAHRWLGDRALLGGHFTRALAYYASIGGERHAPAPDLAAHQRLAAAMLGRSLGEPVSENVRVSQTEMTPAEFETLVAEMIRQHGTAETDPKRVGPARGGFQLRRRLPFDVPTGKSPENVPAALQNTRIDWVARQLAVTIRADVLYLGNRFCLSAYDLKGGSRRWQADLSDGKALAHAWSLLPMRPLVVEDRIFLRVLSAQGPGLVCLSADGGRKLWETGTVRGRYVISDPLLAANELLALTAVDEGGPLTVSLTAYDPHSGEVLRTRPMVQLESSFVQLPFCGVAARGDSILATLGGSVLRCDRLGRVRWLRKQPWRSPAQSPGVIRQHCAPPLLAGGRLYVAQPGVPLVECIDPGHGRLLWSRPSPDVYRLLGVVDRKLIVRTGRALVALSAATGQRLWQHAEPEMFAAELCGPQGDILYARREAAAQEKMFQVQLVRLDAAAGKPAARCSLPDLNGAQPRFGPMIAQQGQVWAIFGDAPGARRELIQLVAKEESEADDSGL